MCLADITSANVVGYETTTLLPNDYTMFGVQFEDVAGGGVKFGDLKGNFFGGPTLSDADNIMVWKDGAYHYYYYGVWGDPDYPEWDNLWYNQDDMDASEETIDPGTACWYVRMDSAAAQLSIAGQVKLTPTTITILANDYTMFTCPYPTAITFASLNVANPFGGPTLSDADNIMVWKDGAYHYYYYGVWGDPDYPEWDNLWYNQEDMDASEETINPGIAAWYVRMGDATTMSFTSPLAR